MSEQEFSEKLKRYKNIAGIVIASLTVVIICGVCKFFYDHAILPAQEKEIIALQSKFDMMLIKISSIEVKVDKLCPGDLKTKSENEHTAP